MNSFKALNFSRLLVAGAALLATTAATASVLTARISMDNGYIAYISTSDTIAGTQFAAHNNWPTTYIDTTSLTAGVDYYLHVYGYDQGGVAGFLGDFSLSGTDHQFANNSTALLTNGTDWMANTSGFANAYSAVSTWGTDGVSPWGNRPNINDAATWIWSGNNNTNDAAYFTTKISAVNRVPEPTSIALISVALLGLGLSQRRKRQGAGT